MANFVHIKLRRDTTANWLANNPILELGEVGIDLDQNKAKVGDGSKKWTELNWCGATDIIDNLDSDRTDEALSAAQGKALKTEIAAIVAAGGTPVIDNLDSTSTTSALSANQGRALKEEINAIVSSGGTPVVDNLNSTSTSSALSANQGRVLKSEIDSKANKSDIDDITKKVNNVGIFGMGYTVDNFNGYGKPTKITFDDGVVANLTWSGTRLDLITASTGEKISITYNSDGLITGRTVTRS